MFLNHFSLPDVPSASIPLVHIVSVVVSVSVTVAEHDEPNKVEFVFISIQGEFLLKHCTDIIKQTIFAYEGFSFCLTSCKFNFSQEQNQIL